MIGCHSIVKCRFEAQQRYASTVTPIINFQFSILNFPFMKFSIYEVFHLRSPCQKNDTILPFTLPMLKNKNI